MGKAQAGRAELACFQRW